MNNNLNDDSSKLNLDAIHDLLDKHVKLDRTLDLDNISGMNILQDILYQYVKINCPALHFDEYYPVPNKLALEIVLPNGDNIVYTPKPQNISGFNASNTIGDD